jgi:hypothetical protein
MAWRHLLRRQIAFVLTATAVGTLMAVIQPDAHRVLWLALPLAGGAIAALIDKWLRALLVFAITVVGALAWNWICGGSHTLLDGTTALLVGALTGGGLARWCRGLSDLGTTLLGSLTGATSTGVGFGVIAGWSPAGMPEFAVALITFACLGLVASVPIWMAAVEWRVADRMPAQMQIRRSLSSPFVERVMRVWTRDRKLARKAPDKNTRDGLGEVAAWVYRLSVSLQELSHTIDGIDIVEVHERIQGLESEASKADDLFTRDRTKAAAAHLQQLISHRESLTTERDRISALLLYAEAFLEEAQAGITVARVHPGESIPDRLTDVLSRLRDDALAGTSRRQTNRELVHLS